MSQLNGVSDVVKVEDTGGTTECATMDGIIRPNIIIHPSTQAQKRTHARAVVVVRSEYSSLFLRCRLLPLRQLGELRGASANRRFEFRRVKRKLFV